MMIMAKCVSSKNEQCLQKNGSVRDCWAVRRNKNVNLFSKEFENDGLACENKGN
jgi:hypothetical protein